MWALSARDLCNLAMTEKLLAIVLVALELSAAMILLLNLSSPGFAEGVPKVLATWFRDWSTVAVRSVMAL